MALPLTSNLYPVGPGGGIVTSMLGGNALANANYLRKYNKAKAQYAPQTLQAEAMSKLAYANLMGPQFMAKAMQDPRFMGNLTEEQKNAVKNLVYGAGTGQGTGANFINQMPMQQPQNQQNSSGFIPSAINHLKNLFGMGATQPYQQSIQGTAISRPMQQQQMPQQVQQNVPPIGAAVDENGNNIDENSETNTPVTPEESQGLEALNQGGVPSAKPINMTVDTGQRAKIPEGTYAKKGGQYQGVFEEEKKVGEIRAKQREELDDQYQQALQAEVPVKHLGTIIKNPKFQEMRKFPWFQKLQLDTKAKIGTPEEQKLIGDFQATALRAVAETVMGFKGRILDKEVTLANDMKISPNDTMGVIIGKYPSIVAFNEMTKQRARIANKIMSNEHISKGDALERADKQVDGEAIRSRVEKDIEGYPSREDIEHTAKIRGLTPEEVIKRLKATGKYHG